MTIEENKESSNTGGYIGPSSLGYTPLYNGRLDDFCWIGFGSGSGTNLRECAKIIKPAFIFCDRPKAKLLGLEQLADVPKKVIDGYNYCGSWKKAQQSRPEMAAYLEKSKKFDQEILNLLESYQQEQGEKIDLIVLAGYMRLIREPLLEAYSDKIINVHPANLGLLDNANNRKYVGDDAVYGAIKAKEKTTCSSVILVDGKTDQGEILVRGPDLSLKIEPNNAGDLDKNNDASENNKYKTIEKRLRACANAQQEQLKAISDWPALTLALKMIAEGRFALSKEKYYFNQWRIVYLDHNPLPYGGYKII